jgi:putative DNA primase/helicase
MQNFEQGTPPEMHFEPRGIPSELKTYRQWVLWQQDGGRKVPKNWRTMGNAGVEWANTWGYFDDVARVADERGGLGIGFVLTQSDPFCVVDIDDCFVSTEATAAAFGLVKTFGSYTEQSPSGSGLHIWGTVTRLVRNTKTASFEVYYSRKFITVTGWQYRVAPIRDCTEAVETLLNEQNASKVKREGTGGSQYSTPAVREPYRAFGDDEIWQKLFGGKNGGMFSALYNGDLSVAQNDHSRAVILLLNQLAWSTNGDKVQMKRLIYETGLVSPKFEERRRDQTWIDYLIDDAVAYMGGRRK